jgi:hypothetical protein
MLRCLLSLTRRLGSDAAGEHDVIGEQLDEARRVVAEEVACQPLSRLAVALLGLHHRRPD